MKTYYLGETKGGAYVARASANDYGYTCAAVIAPDKRVAGSVVPMSDAKFSRSETGAVNNLGTYWREHHYELVKVERVTREEYTRVTGKR